MLRKKKGSIEWLEFELLANEAGLAHAIFLRHGGVSDGVYASLNAHSETYDLPENIKENQKKILEVLEIERLISVDTVHGTNIELVTKPRKIFRECDGLMTSESNWGLLMPHADCQAVIFYDPVHHAVANIHAGWRGQMQNIYQQTILKMGQTFQSRPEDLLVAISPSLGPENSEFINFKREIPEKYWSFQFKPTYFNLWELARHQLKESGILSHHIEIAEIDTYANPHDFFSYRRQKKVVGNSKQITGCHSTVAVLKNFA